MSAEFSIGYTGKSANVCAQSLLGHTIEEAAVLFLGNRLPALNGRYRGARSTGRITVLDVVYVRPLSRANPDTSNGRNWGAKLSRQSALQNVRFASLGS